MNCYCVSTCSAFLIFRQVRLLLDSRHSVCRRSFQSLWPINWSPMAAVSFLLWVSWWSALKPSSLSYLRHSIRLKVSTATHRETLWVFNPTLTSPFHLFFVSVLHEVEEDTVEFSWKRNRLFNHTACLVLYQICMEVQYLWFKGAWFIVANCPYIFNRFKCALKCYLSSWYSKSTNVLITERSSKNLGYNWRDSSQKN